MSTGAQRPATGRGALARVAGLAYGLVCYVLFLVVFLSAIVFVTGPEISLGTFTLPTLDGPTGSVGPVSVSSVVVDLVLLTLFASQHSAMARPAFKRWWTRLVPVELERSTFVLAASGCLAALVLLWRPMTARVWEVTGTAGAVLAVVGWLGWVVVLLSTFLIDHFDLFGLRQATRWFGRRPLTSPRFGTPLLYRLVRHPIYLGFLIAFWATPEMSAGHLLFAGATTGYVLVAIRLEEHDLVAMHGEHYRGYARTVRMLVPLPRRRAWVSRRAPRTPTRSTAR
jgi:methanethiol S-methyltransferase